MSMKPRPVIIYPDSLRDYFAAAALTGLYAGYQGNAPEPEQVASDAYFIADMMLKERKERNK